MTNLEFSWFISLIKTYLPTRLNIDQINSLSRVTQYKFLAIFSDLDTSVELYNTFPSCLSESSVSPVIFINTNHLKSLIAKLPSYSSTLEALHNNQTELDLALSEMRDNSYFEEVYAISNPIYLLANLMTLVYRCYILSCTPGLREGEAQISSTLEEMSALRFLLGQDNLHFQSTRHWIKDWEGEGFSQQLSRLIYH